MGMEGFWKWRNYLCAWNVIEWVLKWFLVSHNYATITRKVMVEEDVYMLL